MSQQISEDKVKIKVGLVGLLKRMWPYVTQHKVLLFWTLVSVLLMSAVGRTLPFVIGYAVDEGIQKKAYDVAGWAALVYLILEITKAISIFLYQYLFQKLGNRVLYNVRNHMTEHVQSLPMNYFNTQPTGRIVTRVTNDVNALGELFTGGVVMAFAQVAILISIVVAMFLISVKLTLLVLFLVPLFFYTGYHLSQVVKTVLRKTKAKLAQINAYTAENLNGIEVIQLYNRTEKNRQKFEKLSDEYKDLNISAIRSYALLWPTMNLFNAATIGLALYFGSLIRLNGELPIGSLIAFFMLVQDFLQPLRTILERYIQFQNSLTSGERVFTLFDEAPEADSVQDSSEPSPAPTNSTREPVSVSGHIRFENVHFQYQPHLPYALKGISLDIQPGESIAIIGRTGSGKSTMISLLQRFYDYSEGEISFDGTPLNQCSRDFVRKHVGVVQQDGFTFRGTLRENITLNNASVSDEAVREAVKKVGLQKTVDRLGLDGAVEERGANLSVGERQLIAFARILAFEKNVLILDEATSNIDSESEQLIQAATSEVTQGRTSIVIAHRLSTIRHCDRIVSLHHGEIIEVGSHEELLQNPEGIYAKLYKAQSTSEELSAAETKMAPV